MTPTPPEDALDPLIGSVRIARRLDTSRTQAWRLMSAGAFGQVFDIAPEGALRAQLRVKASGVQAWLDSRELGEAS